GGEVARLDAHHHAGVGVAFGARVLAHAVGDHTTGFAGGGYHGAAGTHAEAVDGTAVPGVVHQLIVGGTQQRVSGVAAPAGPIDDALRVLDSKAYRERLGLQVHAGIVQQGEGVP